MSGITSVGGTVAKSVSVKSVGVLAILFKNLKIVIFVLAIFSLGAKIYQDSMVDGSTKPFFVELGMRIVFSDQRIYELYNGRDSFSIVKYDDGVKFHGLKNFYSTIITYADTIFQLYFLGLFFWIIYKVVSLRNTSAMGANIFIALLFMVVLQVVFNLYTISQSAVGGGVVLEEDLNSSFYPFRGVLAFAKFLPLIADPVYNYIGFDKTIGINESLNLSINAS